VTGPQDLYSVIDEAVTAYRQRHVGRSLYLSRAAQSRFALRAVGGVWRLAAVGFCKAQRLAKDGLGLRGA